VCTEALESGKPPVPSHKSRFIIAVQSKSMQLHSRLFVTVTSYMKTAQHTVMTWAPVTIICSEIQNFVMVVSAIHDDE